MGISEDDKKILDSIDRFAGRDSMLANMCRKRVEMGAETYGGLILDIDRRVFVQEFMQEIADAVYYALAHAEQLRSYMPCEDSLRKVGRATALLCAAFEIMEEE